jgi:hypothetical protein
MTRFVVALRAADFVLARISRHARTGRPGRAYVPIPSVGTVVFCARVTNALTDCRPPTTRNRESLTRGQSSSPSRNARGCELKYFVEFLIVVVGALLGTYLGRRIRRSTRADLRRRRLWIGLGLVGCILILMLLLPWLL